MKRFSLALLFTVATLAGPRAVSAADAPTTAPSDAEVATHALEIFMARCASCHGPEVKKPKKFGYVDDLARMAANPKLVVPGKPDDSSMWTTVEDNEMPPEDDPGGPLTDEQKKWVKLWVERGAPSVPATAVATTGPAAAVAKAPAAPVKQKSLLKRVVVLVGHTHPLVVHFPIALLMVAAIAEVFLIFDKAAWLDGAVRGCTIFGAAGAIVGAAVGWVDAIDHTSSDLLSQHRLLGTAAAVLSLVAVGLSERGMRRSYALESKPMWRGGGRWAFRIVLFALVILTGVAGHLGGAMVYGEDYFSL